MIIARAEKGKTMSDERLKELSTLATYQFAAIFNEKNMQMTIGEIVEKLYDIDLVRVVRCKDCKYRLKEWRGDKRMKDKGYWVYGCEHFAELMGYWGWGGNDNEYCSCGERKETE